MGKEFLTWIFLECYYEAFRQVLARQGSIINREVFVNLQVVPTWKPGSVAQLFGMGAEIIGMNLAQPVAPNRPMMAPNGRG